MKTLLGNVLSWGLHPTYSEGTAAQWGAGVVLILIASFLWAMVLREID
jgi:hypothetical protein